MKEMVSDMFKILSEHVSGGTEENHENVSDISRPLSQESNPALDEHETGLLTTRQQYLVTRSVLLQRNRENSGQTSMHRAGFKATMPVCKTLKTVR
jgi:hypothetical protein